MEAQLDSAIHTHSSGLCLIFVPSFLFQPSQVADHVADHVASRLAVRGGSSDTYPTGKDTLLNSIQHIGTALAPSRSPAINSIQ